MIKKYFGLSLELSKDDKNRGLMRVSCIAFFFYTLLFLFSMFLKGDKLGIIMFSIPSILLLSVIFIDFKYFKNPNVKNKLLRMLFRIINSKTFKPIDKVLTWKDEIKHQKMILFFILMIVMPFLLFIFDSGMGYYFEDLDLNHRNINNTHIYTLSGQFNFAKTSTDFSEEFFKSIFDTNLNYDKYTICFNHIIDKHSNLTIKFKDFKKNVSSCVKVTNNDILVPFNVTEVTPIFNKDYEYKYVTFLQKDIKKNYSSQILSITRSVLSWWVVMLLIWTIFEKLIKYYLEDSYLKL